MLGNPLVRFCEGSGDNPGYGRDIVAPPGNQADNGEHKLRPKVRGVPDLLETPFSRRRRALKSFRSPFFTENARATCLSSTGIHSTAC